MPDPQYDIPKVSDEDVDWVCGVMKLRAFDQPRRDFLRATKTLDVPACPGSGKTTLIVAKLAIMARKWPHRTKGICVLSHTNVAREEIQHRLRDTLVGQHLLGYPHFIDTIHGFVNRFMALPWLNSNGIPSPIIDDEATSIFRRTTLTRQQYQKIETLLNKRNSGFEQIRLHDRHLSFGLKGDTPFPAGPSTPTYSFAKSAVKAAANAGFFCHDEMFIWASALLSDHPNISVWLQQRFPLVIVDEMQDTTELQAKILHSVFPRQSCSVVVQRVGDPNQAIYDGAEASRRSQDKFPDSSRCLSIPNSFRFGRSIAKLASPFAVSAVGTSGLQGNGPRPVADAPDDCCHAVFIFPKESTAGVLEAYGRHVLSIFGDAALAEGIVTAVGAVHQDAVSVTPGHQHFPKTVPHYWSGYAAGIAKPEPHPRTLIQYVWAAQTAALDNGNLSPGVDRIAAGLARLARLTGDAALLSRRTPNHRTLLDALRPKPEAEAVYRRLLRAFLIDWEPKTSEVWKARQAELLQVAESLSETVSSEAITSDFVTSFLGWKERDPLTTAAQITSQAARANIYRVDDGAGRSVDIRLGSVHSVKGQTHLATLLLSTYWYDHSSKKMLPWLLGDKVNLSDAGARDQVRLRQTYVAMTRPSHLICLAVPRFVFGEDSTLRRHIATLKCCGWRVADIVDGAARWCP